MNLAFPGALSHTWYVVTSVLFLMTHAAFYLVVSLPRCIDSIHMIHVSRVVLLAGIVAAGFVSLIFGSILATVAIGLMVYVLAWRDRQYTWSAVSGLVFAGTLINGWDGESLIWAGIIALATNIILALHFRSDYNRWISTGLWLFMPITVAHALYPNGLETMYYAWMYLVVMLALILSRFIAIGSLLLSTSVPMIVYAKTASISYVVGYVVAGFLAFCLSINSGMDNFGAVAVSSWISLLMLLVARFIEKEPEISVVQPILWQVIAFGFLRSLKVDLRIDIFLGLSTLVAVVIYALADWWRHLYRQSRIVDENTVIFALLTSLITPAYYFVYDITKISMIIGLFVVSGLTYHYWRNRSQGYKEVSITVFTASVMWGMHYFGVREFQAYTHVFAIMLAFFAWMRHELGQVIKSDEYIYGALSVSTVPLAIQAMSSVSGGVYGWVLLLEQVLIMLIGMSIRKRFVLMWGLYVSVGAVLYQLRDLGYAALAVLATFIIGVAVYQLQKYNK
ncbi:hypothetical protein KC867_00615, partial [Candidatus Saccharibacteria bacterium]|nr:hypothetical protein [Candidatus Saccharibacteria bacterium]